MASGHGVPKPRKENHPNRQVSRSSFSDALDARGREYDAVRAGTMSDEQARRVDIDPNKVRGYTNLVSGVTHSITEGGWESVVQQPYVDAQGNSTPQLERVLERGGHSVMEGYQRLRED